MKAKNKRKKFEVEITEADHRQMIAEGAEPEYALKPGRHTFRRGAFRKRHPDFDPSQATSPKKERVTIMLDSDVIDYFKKRASRPNAAPYQTQINAALRAAMRRGTQGDLSPLVDDERFIDQVAERVKAKLESRA